MADIFDSLDTATQQDQPSGDIFDKIDSNPSTAGQSVVNDTGNLLQNVIRESRGKSALGMLPSNMQEASDVPRVIAQQIIPSVPGIISAVGGAISNTNTDSLPEPQTKYGKDLNTAATIAQLAIPAYELGKLGVMAAKQNGASILNFLLKDKATPIVRELSNVEDATKNAMKSVEDRFSLLEKQNRAIADKNISSLKENTLSAQQQLNEKINTITNKDLPIKLDETVSKARKAVWNMNGKLSSEIGDVVKPFRSKEVDANSVRSIYTKMLQDSGVYDEITHGGIDSLSPLKKEIYKYVETLKNQDGSHFRYSIGELEDAMKNITSDQFGKRWGADQRIVGDFQNAFLDAGGKDLVVAKSKFAHRIRTKNELMDALKPWEGDESTKQASAFLERNLTKDKLIPSEARNLQELEKHSPGLFDGVKRIVSERKNAHNTINLLDLKVHQTVPEIERDALQRNAQLLERKNKELDFLNSKKNERISQLDELLHKAKVSDVARKTVGGLVLTGVAGKIYGSAGKIKNLN